jgi:hypothetical protein
MTDSSAEKQQPAGLADAQVTGGGGHEPDLEDSGTGEGQARVPAAGSGVDLKSEGLDEQG